MQLRKGERKKESNRKMREEDRQRRVYLLCLMRCSSWRLELWAERTELNPKFQLDECRSAVPRSCLAGQQWAAYVLFQPGWGGLWCHTPCIPVLLYGCASGKYDNIMWGEKSLVWSECLSRPWWSFHGCFPQRDPCSSSNNCSLIPHDFPLTLLPRMGKR